MTISAKCNGEGCDIKRNCYRFRAIPTANQYYIRLQPHKKDGRCVEFVFNGGGKPLIPMTVK